MEEFPQGIVWVKQYVEKHYNVTSFNYAKMTKKTAYECMYSIITYKELEKRAKITEKHISEC